MLTVFVGGDDANSDLRARAYSAATGVCYRWRRQWGVCNVRRVKEKRAEIMDSCDLCCWPGGRAELAKRA